MDNNSKRFWAWPDELHRRGILGINQRNLDFILEHNPRGLYPRVDNKSRPRRSARTMAFRSPKRIS